jgi:hypothetical protein
VLASSRWKVNIRKVSVLKRSPVTHQQQALSIVSKKKKISHFGSQSIIFEPGDSWTKRLVKLKSSPSTGPNYIDLAAEIASVLKVMDWSQL